MSRVCQLTGKRANNGMAVSHSHVRTKKLQQVNLQKRRLWWAEGNRFITLRVSTRTLKTIQKRGLGAYAKELGINLARICAPSLAAPQPPVAARSAADTSVFDCCRPAGVSPAGLCSWRRAAPARSAGAGLQPRWHPAPGRR